MFFLLLLLVLNFQDRRKDRTEFRLFIFNIPSQNIYAIQPIPINNFKLNRKQMMVHEIKLGESDKYQKEIKNDQAKEEENDCNQESIKRKIKAKTEKMGIGELKQNRSTKKTILKLITFILSVSYPLTVSILVYQSIVNNQNENFSKTLLYGLSYYVLGGLVLILAWTSYMYGILNTLQCYLFLDSINPFIISTIISYFAFDQKNPENYQQYYQIFKVCNPIYSIAVVGHLRCQFRFYDWSLKVEVIFMKLVIGSCAIIYFLIGVQYLNQSSQSLKYFPAFVRTLVRSLILMVIFSFFDLYVELFKKMSQVDGTDQMEYHYSISLRTKQQILQEIVDQIYQQYKQKNLSNLLNEELQSKSIHQNNLKDDYIKEKEDEMEVRYEEVIKESFKE